MRARFGWWGAILICLCAPGWAGRAPAAEPGEATLRIHAAELEKHRVPRNLTGKFCEHLGANIYNGMDAQILRNPTFADYPFATPEATPDGVSTFQFEREKIEAELRRQAQRSGWPESEIPALLKARQDGLACFWTRSGSSESVRVSPDTARAGQRAQRIEVQAGNGIEQWTWLPLHRQRAFEVELLARSPTLEKARISVRRSGASKSCATALVEGISPAWANRHATLALPENEPAEAAYCVTLSAEEAGQLVIGHLFLRPVDHVNGADPDVVSLLKAARLPLLRWPGGNFVSAYHWEDGVGPMDARPTLPNYAWGGIEPNTFGTDEFINFCRAVGCEPMICVNAGTGTPEEAARWIEYCNGPVTSPMGARRAANGHPEAFGVRYWEVGNELWGRWQARWTTAKGYVDRYQRFAQAMRAADGAIELLACGAPVLWGKSWNDTLIAGLGAQFQHTTDHPLVGGDVSAQDDPLDIYRDFMRVPDVLGQRWGALRRDMESAGVGAPRLAVTELQLFAHLRGPGSEPRRLTQDKLVNPGTLAEALYDTLIYHTAVRLQPFVEMVTHSATVNHGGGLRKERERVYANPCYYANLLFAEFADSTPVKTELSTPQEQAPLKLPDIKRAGGDPEFGVVDAVAAVSVRGILLVSLVNRGTGGPVRTKLNIDGFVLGGKAVVRTVSGEHPWDANTLEYPRRVEIRDSEAEARGGTMSLELPPFSVVQVGLSPGH
jgi:alpha-L-arabinofuranosidase